MLIKCGCSGHWLGGYDNKQRKNRHAQKGENTVDERDGDDVIDTYIFFSGSFAYSSDTIHRDTNNTVPGKGIEPFGI